MKKKSSIGVKGHTSLKPEGTDLFDRVVSILEQARANTVRAINNNMVIAYWLIGREIVLEIQGGEERAEYGKQVMGQLSEKLTHKYGRGFSTTNLRYFRTFYAVYSDRIPEIRHIGCGESKTSEKCHTQSGVLDAMALAVGQSAAERGFSPNLGWSHYRALMNVENRNERLFYEIEAESEGWDVEHLNRQMHTLLFARLLKSRDKAGVLELAGQGQKVATPADTIKNPYILDFFGLPDSEIFHESEIEKAIIDNLQSFLLELGKGFAFMSRQKRMQFDADYFYVDLVFYNCILKCYLLIDLKIGELTHQDVGQMDSYVRMFDDKYLTEGDNPTIGLILCAKKNETIARYSVLKENKQIFASKYMLYLPTEEELRREIERERRLIEEGRTGIQDSSTADIKETTPHKKRGA
jgi:predicted nuclease of restriction endonuclease-like (RecB) superfamily